MMPCRYCEAFGARFAGVGIKQVGRTLRQGQKWARRYRCRDCGSTMEMTGPGQELLAFESWLPPAQAPWWSGQLPSDDPKGICGLARKLEHFVLRRDGTGAYLVPSVSLRDRNGMAVGFFQWGELAADVRRTATAQVKGKGGGATRLYVSAEDVRRFLADPAKRVLEARTAGGDLLPILLRPAAEDERVTVGGQPTRH
jgi:hypothetical protein